jgi:hypothetical protein
MVDAHVGCEGGVAEMSVAAKRAARMRPIRGLTHVGWVVGIVGIVELVGLVGALEQDECDGSWRPPFIVGSHLLVSVWSCPECSRRCGVRGLMRVLVGAMWVGRGMVRRSYGVMVSTLDFESSDPGSNPGRSLFLCGCRWMRAYDE